MNNTIITNDISTATINHFTRFENIVNILKSKYFEPHYCLENINHINWKKFLGVENIVRLAYPMVCFTDLPHDKWYLHKKKYGNCVITLTEEWKLRNHLIPVIYLTQNNTLADSLLPICLRMAKMYCEEHPEKKGFENFINMLLVFFKLYQEDDKRYYDEREWRYVPWKGMDKLDLCLPEDTYNIDNIRKKAQSKILLNKDNLLYFNFTDIVNIEVSTDNEKEQVTKLLMNIFDVNYQDAKSKVSLVKNSRD